MEARVEFKGEMRFEGKTESGFTLVMDSPSEGDPPAGPTPMEMALLAGAGCTGLDVIWTTNRMRRPVAELVIEATAERAEEDPKVFTAIHFVYRAKGRGIEMKHLRRAIDLSLEKYCSVLSMLKKGGVTVTYEATLEEP